MCICSPDWLWLERDGKVVRKSTEVKISGRTPKAFEKSQAAARQHEALIKQEYFRQKEEAVENAGAKADITLQEFSKKFLDWVEIKHQKKPKTVRYYKQRVAAILRFDKFKNVLLSRIDDELIADFIQWRSKTTVVVAIRGKKGKITTADTYRPVKVATINRDLTALKLILNYRERLEVPHSATKDQKFVRRGRARACHHTPRRTVPCRRSRTPPGFRDHCSR